MSVQANIESLEVRQRGEAIPQLTLNSIVRIKRILIIVFVYSIINSLYAF